MTFMCWHGLGVVLIKDAYGRYWRTLVVEATEPFGLRVKEAPLTSDESILFYEL